MPQNDDQPKALPDWLWLLVAALVLSTLPALALRHQAEAANRAVSIAVEFSTLRELASAQNLPLPEALIQLRDAGADTLALNERTAGELTSTGEILVAPAPLSTTGAIRPAFTATAPPQTIALVQEAHQARTGTTLPVEPNGSLLVPDPVTFRNLSLGIDEEEARLAAFHSFQIIARHANSPGTTPASIEWTLRRSDLLGANAYLPLGDAVLGDRTLIPATAKLLQNFGILYVGAEFSKTSGESPLAKRLLDQTIRLHAAQAAELARMTPEAIVERYAKAARERNVRVLLLRPATLAAEAPFDEFRKLVRAVARQLHHDGLAAKNARPFPDPAIPRAATAAVGALVALTCALATLLIVTRKTIAPHNFVALGGIALPIGALLLPSPKILALAAAVLLPCLAYFWFVQRPDRPAWRSYLGVSAISLAGGLPVAALLTGQKFMLQLDQFLGVKLAVFFPILVAAVLLARIQSPLSETAKKPVLWGTLALAIVALAALAFMNARTGNDNPAAVSGLELQLRDLLDAVLFARPRTKEFLIGHPAFVLGLALLAFLRNNPTDSRHYLLRPAALALVAIGAIAQTSVVNTLCHLHTPLLLSLARILTGHILGCIIGLAVWALVRALLQGRQRAI